MREYVLDKLGVQCWSLRTADNSMPCFIGASAGNNWLIMVESQGSAAALALAKAIGRVIDVEKFVVTDAAVEELEVIGEWQRVLVLGKKLVDSYKADLAVHANVCMCAFLLDDMLENTELKAELWRKLRPFC